MTTKENYRQISLINRDANVPHLEEKKSFHLLHLTIVRDQEEILM